MCSMESVLSHETGISGAMTPLSLHGKERDALSKIDNESESHLIAVFDLVSAATSPLTFPRLTATRFLCKPFHHDTHLLLPASPSLIHNTRTNILLDIVYEQVLVQTGWENPNNIVISTPAAHRLLFQSAAAVSPVIALVHQALIKL